VDEIHAVADDKRGAHLALSLERLDHLTGKRLTRIGLSATQKPIELVAHFLAGNDRPDPTVVQIGHRRELDLAVEVPGGELGPVASNEMWAEIYDRLAALATRHRSTLIFVNTRRLAERMAHHLAERLGKEVVAAHHGSLSRKLRLVAERKLKSGELRAIVATASLELGIDIGAVDLVCQIGSPRSISVGLQRIGRAGHWRGAVPKGRIFATTRDELLECAALVRAIRQGDLDRIAIPEAPLDILAQQIVAMCAAEDWNATELFRAVRRAYPYRDLARAQFDEILEMLSEGIASTRGRYAAYLHHDRVNGIVRARVAAVWRQLPAAVPFRRMRCTPYLRSPKARLSARLTKTSPSKASLATSCCWGTLPGESGEFKPAVFWLKTRRARPPPFHSGAAKHRHGPMNSQRTSEHCENKSARLFLVRSLIQREVAARGFRRNELAET